MTPTAGRIVHYVLTDRNGKLQTRPAIIVQVWSEDMVNLQVFTDGSNDNEYGVNTMWKTSVHRSEEKKDRTWDWMPYQKQQAQAAEDKLPALYSFIATTKDIPEMINDVRKAVDEVNIILGLK